MDKIIIIGIDGLDPILLNQWRDVLPNFCKILKFNNEPAIKSTFPPDSICAWTSIFTGLNPAEHGVLESIDYLSNKNKKAVHDSAGDLKGRTFWDVASQKGKRVCIINPFLAYPAWSVNGVMISGPVFEGGDTSVFPEQISQKYKLPPLGGIVDFPDEKELESFLSNAKTSTKELADVSLKIFYDQKADLFFVTFLTLDRIKHFLWRFTDKSDPFYPGKNKFSESIKEFYILFDEIVGSFLTKMEHNDNIVILSDHGHRKRCTKCLNLNEFLRQKGLITTSSKGIVGIAKIILEKLKILGVSTFAALGMQDLIYRIAKLIPNRKALKKSTYLINQKKSKVMISGICGANPYAGININLQQPEEYEKLREKIIKELKQLNTDIGLPVIKWVKKREEVYAGERIANFPDILLELEDDYGVGMNLFTSLISQNYNHKKISGGHKMESVFLTYGSRAQEISHPKSIVDIKKYILEIMGITNNENITNK